MGKRSIAVAACAVVAITASAALGSSAKVVELYADLSGKVEVPTGAANGTGKVEVKLNKANGRVCWEFSGLKGLEGKPLLSHIHKAPAGKAGDVVVPLGQSFKLKGCTTASKQLVAAILAKPGRYYVNVHNDKFPAGAVRGQLSRTEA